MATPKKTWTDADYFNEAMKFFACYGVGNDWYEFVQEYCATWDRTNEFKRPDQDRLLNAVLTAAADASGK